MSSEGLRIGSLCSGAGMLDEGVRAVLGGEVVWHAEHEPATDRNGIRRGWRAAIDALAAAVSVGTADQKEND